MPRSIQARAPPDHGRDGSRGRTLGPSRYPGTALRRPSRKTRATAPDGHTPELRRPGCEKVHRAVKTDTPRLTTRRLNEMGLGFMHAGTLLAAIELGLFDALGEGPRTPAEVSASIGVDEQRTEKRITACASLALLEREAGRVRNAPDVDRFLVRGKPTCFGDSLAHFGMGSYAGWGKVAEHLRSSESSSRRYYDLTQNADEACRRNPGLRATVFDALPSGGGMILCDSMIHADRTGPPVSAFLSLSLHFRGGSGKVHDAREFRSYLEEAGFRVEQVEEFVEGSLGWATAVRP